MNPANEFKFKSMLEENNVGQVPQRINKNSEIKRQALDPLLRDKNQNSNQDTRFKATIPSEDKMKPDLGPDSDDQESWEKMYKDFHDQSVFLMSPGY